MIFKNSSLILSLEIAWSQGLFFLIALLVFSSISKPKVAANLTARIILKASSLNLSSGLPTARIILSSKSFCPLKGSIILNCLEFRIWNLEFVSDFGFRISDFTSRAMALIVKSRLDRSSSIVLANFISSGWRLSVYFASFL